MNSVILSGNIGKDPSFSTTPSGTAVLNFNLAVDNTYMSNGKRVKETQWFKIVVWGRQAEHQAQYLQSGSEITVRGELRARAYEDQNGVRRQVVEIVADEIKWHQRIRSPQLAEAVSESTPSTDF